MDPTSSLKSEIFRPLTSVIIPGIVAGLPIAALVFHTFPELRAVFTNPLGTTAIILIGSVLFGLIMENLGSCLEDRLWSCIIKKQCDAEEHWKIYLGLYLNDEMIGQRYLRTIHTRLKFELGMVPACTTFLIFGIWYTVLSAEISCREGFIIGGLVIALGVYLGFEAKSSLELLTKTRREIIKSYNSKAK